MDKKIKDLIKMALADGEVTDKERAIILRKAEALGENKDEVEMILDGKLALMLKEKHGFEKESKSKYNREDQMNKCPSCGSSTESFSSQCSACGHEFRNIEANKSISALYDAIQNIDKSKFDDEMDYEEKIAMIITAWPIPNTKEDLLEFLSQGIPEATKKMSFWDKLDKDRAPYLYKRSWAGVCEKLILKSRFSMKDDKKTLDEINFYADQLNLNSESTFSIIKKKFNNILK